MSADKLNFIGPHEGRLRFTFRDGRTEDAGDPKGVARLLGQLQGETFLMSGMEFAAEGGFADDDGAMELLAAGRRVADPEGAA